MQTNKSWWL
jgi:hypothetical protein